MDNPFSWNYLTTVPGSNEVLGPFAIGFLALFGLGFLASTLLYNGGGRKLFANPVLFRMACKWAGVGLVIAGLGLFFFVIRALQINPFTFGMRIWLWLSLLALAAFAAYILYDLRAHYEGAKAEYEEYKRKQLYLRATASGTPTRQAGRQLSTAPAPRPVRKKRR
ncbi:MAG: hypothetical protein ACR2OO_13715 [Thermomicrobiales bacterium]